MEVGGEKAFTFNEEIRLMVFAMSNRFAPVVLEIQRAETVSKFRIGLNPLGMKETSDALNLSDRRESLVSQNNLIDQIK